MSMQPPSDPQFFGKDKGFEFFGFVEDVNDPKRSGRVRVRCLGIHPAEKEGGDGVKTEDLPWAHVEMPTTHAQQERIGGKHGLRPGTFVRGYFLDGREAQKPVVVGTYNFTARTTEQNIRERVDLGDGDLTQQQEGFGNVETTTPNPGLYTEEEMQTGEGDSDDKNRYSPRDDSTDGTCPQEPNAFATKKTDPKDGANSSSQNWSNQVTDGLCGTVQSARSQIQSIIEEKLPGDSARFLGQGDVSFNALTGNRLNLNATMMKMSQEICSIMKDPIQSMKQSIQKTANNEAFRTGLLGATSRSPIPGMMADISLSTKFDQVNAIIDRSLDQLCQQVMQAMKQVNNQQQSGQGDNSGSDVGTSRTTVIRNVSSVCITDSVINTIKQYFDEVEQQAQNETNKEYERRLKKIRKLESKILQTAPEDIECVEEFEEEIIEDAEEIQDELGGDSGGGESSDISSMLQMLLNMDFTMDQKVLNKAGPQSIDAFTSGGCSPFDLYNTMEGLMGSGAGSGSSASGGGSSSGKSSKDDSQVQSNIGFGGVPLEIVTTVNDPICEEARTGTISQDKRERRRKKMRSWAPVDYYSGGQQLKLRGEQEFSTLSGRLELSDRSRVLVMDQKDKSENGLYETAPGRWKRTFDANQNKEFKRRKTVKVKSLRKRQNIFYYAGKNNPRLEADDIVFKRVVFDKKDDFPTNEKDVLDPDIVSVPGGFNGRPVPISLPSDDPDEAANYASGLPTGILIKNPGSGYFFDSPVPGESFPSIFIRGYTGTPTPVVDRNTGELVSILVSPNSFGGNPFPSVSVLSDNSTIGLTSDDERYDLRLCDLYVQNTGRRYSADTKIKVIDKDSGLENGQVRPVIKEERIIDVEIINTGSGFRRLPEIIIEDKFGFSAKVYPILCLFPREETSSTIELAKRVHVSMCPSRNRVNYASQD